MNNALKIIAGIWLVFLSGCVLSKYHHAEEISFISDYPRLLREGAVTRFDTYITKGKGITIYVYKEHGKMYRIKEPYSKEMDETLDHDLKEGDVIVDSPELRRWALTGGFPKNYK